MPAASRSFVLRPRPIASSPGRPPLSQVLSSTPRPCLQRCVSSDPPYYSSAFPSSRARGQVFDHRTLSLAHCWFGRRLSNSNSYSTAAELLCECRPLTRSSSTPAGFVAPRLGRGTAIVVRLRKRTCRLALSRRVPGDLSPEAPGSRSFIFRPGGSCRRRPAPPQVGSPAGNSLSVTGARIRTL